MRKTLVWTLLCMLFLVQICYAATLQGNTYNFNLQKIDDVIVGINTQPAQTFVAKNGSYEFDVNPGQYTIAAVYKTNGDKLSMSQKIIIQEEGEFILDLILFPSIEDEEEILSITTIDFGEDYFKKDYSVLLIVLIVLLVFVAVLVFVLIKRKPKQGPEERFKIVQVPEHEKDEAEKIMDFIKKEGGRTTQKHIRKEFPSSEAKISLVIAELENKGKIEKIKKGRGNIVKLK